MAEGALLYILRCSDGSFYIGITRTALETRVAQHNAGVFGGYTSHSSAGDVGLLSMVRPRHRCNRE